MTIDAALPVTMSDLSPYLRRYQSPTQLGIKVNAYRDYEVAGLAAALRRPELEDSPLECVMVGDSYFMTHVGRASTVMADEADRSWALETLVALVREVRGALDAEFPVHRRPFLLADLPDGATESTAAVKEAATRFTDAGADAVKIEVAADHDVDRVQTLAERGTPTLAHIGYSPQKSRLGRYGDASGEALALFTQARRLRDAGACGLVLEMVSEPVNQALARPNPAGIPVYSVFSGRARWGGQSLNVWDAVVRPPRRVRHFPPTADLDRSEVAEKYSVELIADRMAELIQLTLFGWFPLSPRSALTPAEVTEIDQTDPWGSE